MRGDNVAIDEFGQVQQKIRARCDAHAGVILPAKLSRYELETQPVTEFDDFVASANSQLLSTRSKK